MKITNLQPSFGPDSLEPVVLSILAEQSVNLGQYDLAALILYRAFDLFCLQQAERIGIPPRVVTIPGPLPVSVVNFWKKKRTEFVLPPKSIEKEIRIGLTDRILLLAGFKVLPRRKKELQAIFSALDIRNNCWLAHGNHHVGPDQWMFMKRNLLPLITAG